MITFCRLPALDERNVVFGCLCTKESFDCLEAINAFGTDSGQPLEEITITDAGIAYPRDKTRLNAS
jgi:hypothetical protein